MISDKVKLIVTLNKGQYENLKNIQCGSIGSRMIVNAVINGIPLDDIKAEIKTCEIRHDFRIAEKDTKSRELMHGIFSDVYGVFARIGNTESEDKE